MGRFAPRVEKNHPNHFGQNKVGMPVRTCRYCQNIWEYVVKTTKKAPTPPPGGKRQNDVRSGAVVCE